LKKIYLGLALILFAFVVQADAPTRMEIVQGSCDDAKVIVNLITTESKAVKSRFKTGDENMPLNTVLDAQLNGMQELKGTIKNWAKFNCQSI